jgi:acyl-[acyl-carrier-protein]-phospholipid O-acyltransferase/long-chain-fatty-acid--[acyl-carrier-protein] ligase
VADAEKLPDWLASAFEDMTGDIAMLDEHGFLQITDRLSRFSKIGGEMVPHVKVEENLHELVGAREMTFAVAGVPDPKKGERLIVLHTLPDDQLQGMLKRLPQLELPNLWIPRANSFFRVEKLPQLASGKMDLRRIRELGLNFARDQEAQGAGQNTGHGGPEAGSRELGGTQTQAA